MLKFQYNHTTVIANFINFILTAYVIIDDLYRQFVPPEVMQRWYISDAKLSDPEIITIGICGELAGIDSEDVWFSLVKGNYRHFFQIIAAEAVLIVPVECSYRQRNCSGKNWRLFFLSRPAHIL